MIDYFTFIFMVTVKCFNLYNFLIFYYSLFISIKYVIISKYLYFILSIIYLLTYIINQSIIK